MAVHPIACAGVQTALVGSHGDNLCATQALLAGSVRREPAVCVVCERPFSAPETKFPETHKTHGGEICGRDSPEAGNLRLLRHDVLPLNVIAPREQCGLRGHHPIDAVQGALNHQRSRLLALAHPPVGPKLGDLVGSAKVNDKRDSAAPGVLIAVPGEMGHVFPRAPLVAHVPRREPSLSASVRDGPQRKLRSLRLAVAPRRADERGLHWCPRNLPVLVLAHGCPRHGLATGLQQGVAARHG
mmetsp:Transcript_61914/g.191862  ORF Transcript_61914/g.191862 Transcript_61914/m.191862 type:complete len:242 (-) Transcript_61914:198-923(-)